MSNKEKALESLYYRLEALAGQFVNSSGDDAVAVAKKINVYGRTKEILEREVEAENKQDKDVPAKEITVENEWEAPKDIPPYPTSYGYTSPADNAWGWR